MGKLRSMRWQQKQKDYGDDKWKKSWELYSRFSRRPCYQQNYRDWERPWNPSSEDYYTTQLPMLQGYEAWKEQENSYEMFPQNEDTFYCTKCHSRVRMYMEKTGKCVKCRRSKHR